MPIAQSVRQHNAVKGEFTAMVAQAPEGGYWATCPEVPCANDQGEALEEAKASLCEAVGSS
jgi:predicted RNase H-like HicB family nuclease